ncbi:hypothetical protein HZA45_02590 [Candidatus Peregrinibacteria bacterium]|nr:hypothetical protein [Candidatus Peregrinibacteria bacterium]
MPGASAPPLPRISILRVLVLWYLVGRPLLIIRSYLRYAAVFAESFSFVFLFRTLFAPWKNITDAYPKRGFDLNLMLQAMMFNVITRAIGCVVRVGAILCGVVVQVLLFSGFAVYLVVWLLFPLILPSGILTLLGLL